MAELTVNSQDDGDGEGFGVITEREPDETSEGTEAPVTETPATEEAPKTEETPTEEGTGETPVEGQETEPKTEGTDEPERTEKGTIKDPNPLSAAHQELANEKAKSRQMARVLSDSKLLSEYMKTQFPNAEAKAEAPKVEVKKYTPEDFDSLEDVAGVVNGLQEQFAEKLEKADKQVETLTAQVNSLVAGGEAARVATTMASDVDSLRKENELDPNNPEFIEGLEDKIAQAYHNLDFDEKTGGYRGSYSLAEIGKDMIEVARSARAAGSKKAQTVVKDKSAGKVVTSPNVEAETDTDEMSAGDSIAAGISKTFR